jgi:hypothetical protein
MRSAAISKLIRPTLVLLALCLASCGLVGVELTSSPQTVRRGDPVTFNIKLTNHSACPVEQAVAVLIPFIPLSQFNAELDPSQLGPDAPPEIVQFFELLRAFFDVLCAGGTPTLPTSPLATAGTARAPEGLSTHCHIGPTAIECEMSGRLREAGNAMTFALFNDELHCHVDGQFVGCTFEMPLSEIQTPAGVTSAASTPLTCVTAADLGVPEIGQEFGALCFIGTFPNFMGLGPNQMATGQVTLPATGSGTVRNLVFVISSPDAEDAGVCKGGANGGMSCDLSDSSPCPGSTCGEGICIGGDRNGLGCDVAMQATDCPNNGVCRACSDVDTSAFLPVDCTTTYVSPEPTPVMSPLALVGMAALLLAFGTLWLRRRRTDG